MAIESCELSIVSNLDCPVNPPRGKGADLYRFYGVNPQLNAVFSQVENEVVWVNDEINFPLDLRIGEPSPLGVFAHRMQSLTREESLDSGERVLELMRTHGRSALFGRVLFSDKQGRQYRDIDLKGIGHVADREVVASVGIRKISRGMTTSGTVFGILDEKEAVEDSGYCERFLGLGVRSFRTIGIVKLGEVVEDGVIRRVDDNYWWDGACIQIRAMGTRARIINLDLRNEGARILLEDAKTLVAQELGLPEISDDQYLYWFAYHTGRNLGIVNRAGFVHENITHHNLSLDARITEWDEVHETESDQHRRAHFSNMCACLWELWEKVQWINGSHPDDLRFRIYMEKVAQGYSVGFGKRIDQKGRFLDNPAGL